MVLDTRNGNFAALLRIRECRAARGDLKRLLLRGPLQPPNHDPPPNRDKFRFTMLSLGEELLAIERLASEVDS
jgi:hypothetical protein